MPKKITYFGSEKEIRKAAKIIKEHDEILKMKEPEARLKIQELMDKHELKAHILLNGETVWCKRRILQNVRELRKTRDLYSKDPEDPPHLSHYFYEFLHQECGSVDHYDIHGWIHKYPTIHHLKDFFRSNELGLTVLEHVPDRKADVKNIVKGIESLLYPFQKFMEDQDK